MATITITIKVNKESAEKDKFTRPFCPYTLTELLPIYKEAFPDECPNFDEYIKSSFYKKYILGQNIDEV